MRAGVSQSKRVSRQDPAQTSIFEESIFKEVWRGPPPDKAPWVTPLDPYGHTSGWPFCRSWLGKKKGLFPTACFPRQGWKPTMGQPLALRTLVLTFLETLASLELLLNVCYIDNREIGFLS